MKLMQDLKQADDNVWIGFVFVFERLNSWCRVNRGRLVMKAGGLQRTNSLFWFMACHVTAKVHRISKWQAAGSFCPSLREFILVLRVILK